ncbi:MAG: acyl-CoA-binding protein [Gammaproteobacteria bacterium]
MSEELEQAFQHAVHQIQNSTSRFKPSNALKLDLYGLFKQATEGDITGKKPGLLDAVGRAKYSAWASRGGMSSEEAMRAYLEVYDAKIKAHIEG